MLKINIVNQVLQDKHVQDAVVFAQKATKALCAFLLSVKEDNLDRIKTIEDCAFLKEYSNNRLTIAYKAKIKGFTATKSSCKEDDWNNYRAQQRYVQRWWDAVAIALFPPVVVATTPPAEGQADNKTEGQEQAAAVNMEELLTTIEQVCRASKEMHAKIKALVDSI
jgi:hypothetical protein